LTDTYDHTHWNTRDPVRSPLVKPVRAELVLRWVTTGESSVLYVFLRFCSILSLYVLHWIQEARLLFGPNQPSSCKGDFMCRRRNTSDQT
ncbi:uncharacterized protein PpBr36_10842, partial [Pyricularia pennisetigena]|uniref:uncharacterized protein n=1 Tax=Pyricularia pennisetigena TaxID=1578925 RepID=UPI00114F41C3